MDDTNIFTIGASEWDRLVAEHRQYMTKKSRWTAEDQASYDRIFPHGNPREKG